ncbi:CD1375 family protein [Paenibacillus sp. GYB004]
MVVLSVQLIRAGRRTIEDVPEHLRTLVQQQLNATDQPGEGE